MHTGFRQPPKPPNHPKPHKERARKERPRVRGIPGGAETGTHQTPPAAQTPPQRGVGTDRSRVSAGNLRTTPRPSKRHHPQPHRVLHFNNEPGPQHPSTRKDRHPSPPDPIRPHQLPPPHPKARRTSPEPSRHGIPPHTTPRLPHKEVHPRRIDTRAITTRPPRPPSRTADRLSALCVPGWDDKPTHRPAAAQPLTRRNCPQPRQPIEIGIEIGIGQPDRLDRHDRHDRHC